MLRDTNNNEPRYIKMSQTNAVILNSGGGSIFFILLDIDVKKAKVLRLVSSLPLVSSTLSQKIFSQAYNFNNLMPFKISEVFFRRSVECS